MNILSHGQQIESFVCLLWIEFRRLKLHNKVNLAFPVPNLDISPNQALFLSPCHLIQHGKSPKKASNDF